MPPPPPKKIEGIVPIAFYNRMVMCGVLKRSVFEKKTDKTKELDLESYNKLKSGALIA